MGSGKHQKHAKLKKPAIGNYGRNEWAILGAPCSRIEGLIDKLVAALSSDLKVAYLDADHHAKDASSDSLQAGAAINYTNKIDYHRWEQKEEPDSFRFKHALLDMDLVLVNGNHFVAKRQILILDERKYDSLQRKMDRLSNVRLVLTTPEVDQIPDFLLEAIDGLDQAPKFSIDQIDSIGRFIQDDFHTNTPRLKGLVLAGGKSQRMGSDKGSLVYHNDLPQRNYMYQLVGSLTEEVYLSCHPDQVAEFDGQFNLLPDRFIDLGPFGGMLTAFQDDPDAAWLVVACDLPFIDAACLNHLVRNRNTSQIATAFHNPDSGFPEPLITIWEPRAYSSLLMFLSQGYSCPRKVLINSPVEEIEATNPDWLTNVNTPEEYQAAKDRLKRVKIRT